MSYAQSVRSARRLTILLALFFAPGYTLARAALRGQVEAHRLSRQRRPPRHRPRLARRAGPGRGPGARCRAPHRSRRRCGHRAYADARRAPAWAGRGEDSTVEDRHGKPAQAYQGLS
ncbi:MAG: hypothetical protein M5R42_16750 [Rhodocyclaceae bacterium]|nr:hypothetical protein [Rhodocyclaceae bacterium]